MNSLTWHSPTFRPFPKLLRSWLLSITIIYAEGNFFFTNLFRYIKIAFAKYKLKSTTESYNGDANITHNLSNTISFPSVFENNLPPPQEQEQAHNYTTNFRKFSVFDQTPIEKKRIRKFSTGAIIGNLNDFFSLENSPTKIRTSSGYWGKTTNSPLSLNLEDIIERKGSNSPPVALGVTPSDSPNQDIRRKVSEGIDLKNVILSAESTNEETGSSAEGRGSKGEAEEDKLSVEENIENNHMIQKVLSNLGI